MFLPTSANPAALLVNNQQMVFGNVTTMSSTANRHWLGTQYLRVQQWLLRKPACVIMSSIKMFYIHVRQMGLGHKFFYFSAFAFLRFHTLQANLST